MKQDWTFDSLLEQGLLLAAAKDAEELDQDAEVEFSPKYQKFRKEFLKDPFRCARRKKRPVWKKVLQTAAGLLLAAALGLAALLAVSSEARAGLLQWVRTVGDTSVCYDFFAEPTNQVPPRYEIGALPEGYVEAERNADPKIVSVFYRSENNPRIYLEYMYMEEGVGPLLDTRGVEVSDIEVHGCKGDFYYCPDGTGSNAIVWADETAGILFSIDMWAERDEILRVAESVYLAE